MARNAIPITIGIWFGSFAETKSMTKMNGTTPNGTWRLYGFDDLSLLDFDAYPIASIGYDKSAFVQEMVRMIAGLTPLEGESANDPANPWHYIGRLRISPENDVWFLIFIARRSEEYRPLLSLLHRNGNGWSVVGMFDAAPVLQKLGVDRRIDWEQVKSPAALTPVDQTTPM